MLPGQCCWTWTLMTGVIATGHYLLWVLHGACGPRRSNATVMTVTLVPLLCWPRRRSPVRLGTIVGRGPRHKSPFLRILALRNVAMTVSSVLVALSLPKAQAPVPLATSAPPSWMHWSAPRDTTARGSATRTLWNATLAHTTRLMAEATALCVPPVTFALLGELCFLKSAPLVLCAWRWACHILLCFVHKVTFATQVR